MSLKADFEQAVADSKNLAERPDNMTLLKMYAFYKQGSLGDAQGERPGMTDFIARAKWDNGTPGMSSRANPGKTPCKNIWTCSMT